MRSPSVDLDRLFSRLYDTEAAMRPVRVAFGARTCVTFMSHFITYIRNTFLFPSAQFSCSDRPTAYYSFILLPLFCGPMCVDVVNSKADASRRGSMR